MAKETRDEFENRYNGGERDWLGHSASIECYCDYEECTGWGMVPITDLTRFKMHYNTDAERAAALEHHESLVRGMERTVVIDGPMHVTGTIRDGQ